MSTESFLKIESAAMTFLYPLPEPAPFLMHAHITPTCWAIAAVVAIFLYVGTRVILMSTQKDIGSTESLPQGECADQQALGGAHRLQAICKFLLLGTHSAPTPKEINSTAVVAGIAGAALYLLCTSL